MACQTVGADAALSNAARLDAAPDIRNFKINGVSLVLSHADAQNARLADAHAILTALSYAFVDAESDPLRAERGDTILDLRPRIIAQALEGVANIVAYAQYHADSGRADGGRS